MQLNKKNDIGDGCYMAKIEPYFAHKHGKGEHALPIDTNWDADS